MSGKSKRRRNAKVWNGTLDWMRWSWAFEAEHGRKPTLLDTLKRAYPQKLLSRQFDWGDSPLMRVIPRDKGFGQ